MNDCGGLIFKASVSYYVNSRNEIIQTKKLIPAKRKSCKGCSRCGIEKDSLYEDVTYNKWADMDHIEDGKYYVVLVSKCDDYDIEYSFVEVEV